MSRAAGDTNLTVIEYIIVMKRYGRDRISFLSCTQSRSPVRLYILAHEAQAIQQQFHQTLSILLHLGRQCRGTV